ncbi:UDP-N-acetylglucosamine 4,6-dehydratase (plasmid) [Solidesulfovibrio carbinoliphilus subsp. oakridgensis]|uniref:UDP-N-acetylglucosamine 4,6-dehydratase n=1 Tax=Solidesulfovibrio carbinoliphilus subsp. oakridgensis TaxID=694327 RepID=G7QE73_9BACT|nr:UDP-N-acetylglucosamine 4,6-dehydratase (inverting) [Solidesulfovibrio carbinoliphilus]EHJ45967.1 UDP-N-acetylglucosamine 4,6-dehydratase [Solidesulfovibrio carbinoliphilus subsp. oakridgensis]
MIDGASLLITGGTGSFGKACIRIVLKRYKPRRLIVYSRDELKQWQVRQEFPESEYPCLRFFLGDVRDKDRLYRAFNEVDYVIHAAAMKQVQASEYNPFEAIRTNVFGAQNLIEAAIDKGVKKVVCLSTDKAVAPINLYGATKLSADKLFQAAQAYVGAAMATSFAVVRYGNVLGSRGSVVPLFLDQRDKKGRVTITDPAMTRFWITLPDAVDFVLQTFHRMQGGEIFVPKIPSMSIFDLATALCPGCAHENIGRRPGDKMHETMISTHDSFNSIRFNDHFVLVPSTGNRDRYIERHGGTAVEDGFEYSSHLNDWWMTATDLFDMLGADSQGNFWRRTQFEKQAGAADGPRD